MSSSLNNFKNDKLNIPMHLIEIFRDKETEAFTYCLSEELYNTKRNLSLYIRAILNNVN